MKNSERIKLYLKNKNNPLRKKYENKYKTILESKGNNYWLINAVLFFVFAALYLICFIKFVPLFRYVIIILGVINLISAVILLEKSDADANKLQTKEFSEKIKKLNDKYAKQGYIHDDIDSLYSHTGKCGEYDDDAQMFVCSVDFIPLSDEEQRWCQTEGNCLNCDKLNKTLFPD